MFLPFRSCKCYLQSLISYVIWWFFRLILRLYLLFMYYYEGCNDSWSFLIFQNIWSRNLVFVQSNNIFVSSMAYFFKYGYCFYHLATYLLIFNNLFLKVIAVAEWVGVLWLLICLSIMGSITRHENCCAAAARVFLE